MRRKDVKRKERAEQITQANAVRRIFETARSMVGKMPIAQREVEVHTLLYSALRNQENNRRKAGIKVPDDYVEDTIEAKCRPGSKVDPIYVLCKRCEFCKLLPDGTRRCTEFYCGPKREIYQVAEDEGCSRGLLRKEYR